MDLSLQRAWQVQDNFKPPYCANPSCSYHCHPPHSKWWQNFGYKTNLSFPYRSRRFRCTQCLRTFTHSFFSLNYRHRILPVNESILKFCVSGVSNREIARLLHHSETLIRSRITKMARWLLLFQTSLLQNQIIKEPIVYDGLENFSFSQYDPNNVNHAIGKNSAFTYDFNFAPMNRKGKMSDRQKEIKALLEKKYGCYPKASLRTTSKRLFQRLLEQCEDQHLILYSDRHFQYRKAVDVDLKHHEITHLTISSKAVRNFKNPLFNINNFDMQIRQKSAAFLRETISFAKHSIGMMEKFILFTAFKNFMRPIFYKPHVTDPKVHLESPAQRLGLTSKILSFKDIFRQRVTTAQVQLNEDWERFVRRMDPDSRRPIRPYLGV